MEFKFCLPRCALAVFFLTLCTLPDKRAAKQATKKQPKLTSLKGIMRFLDKKELPNLDWNLTRQLAAAQYMMHLYESVDFAEDNSQTFNVSNVTTTKPVQGVETIMGILNDDTENKDLGSRFAMIFKFNFSAKLQTDESDVQAAELHIYKDIPNYPWMSNATFNVKLSVITIPGNPAPRLKSSLVARDILGWKTGWEIFDVTDTVDMWVASPANNYGLELSVSFPRQDFPIPVDPSKLGFVDFKGPYGQRPFIVSFFKGDPTEKGVVVHASSRKRRSLFKPDKLKYGNQATSTECKKRNLYVDFHELRWQNWIIAPDGYESSYCAGECHYASYSKHNATNHAIVQTLVNLLNPDSAPAPCCAPTKLNAIKVLYYDDKKNVVLKKFQDMVVKSCGCH